MKMRKQYVSNQLIALYLLTICLPHIEQIYKSTFWSLLHARDHQQIAQGNTQRDWQSRKGLLTYSLNYCIFHVPN